jgi:hypothetical protein
MAHPPILVMPFVAAGPEGALSACLADVSAALMVEGLTGSPIMPLCWSCAIAACHPRR